MLSSLAKLLQVRYRLPELYVESSECQGLRLRQRCVCPSVVEQDPGATPKSPEIIFEVLESSMTVPFPDHNYS